MFFFSQATVKGFLIVHIAIFNYEVAHLKPKNFKSQQVLRKVLNFFLKAIENQAMVSVFQA